MLIYILYTLRGRTLHIGDPGGDCVPVQMIQRIIQPGMVYQHPFALRHGNNHFVSLKLDEYALSGLP